MSAQATAAIAQGMTTPKKLRILLLEDIPIEAQLVEEELRRGRIDFTSTRVETREEFVRELENSPPDLIIADYQLPSFDGMSALAIVREKCPDAPFILVSGRISEKRAIEVVQGGATDYLFKDNLSRLVPSVHRALREVQERNQRRQAEEALRASEQRHRLLVEHSHDVILQLDRQGRVVFANPATYTVFGYDPDEFVADPSFLESIILPSSREKYHRVRDQFEAAGVLTEGVDEWMWTRKDGQRVCTENILTNLADDEGQIIGFQLIARDITEKKEAAVELRRSYEKLRRVLWQTVHSLASAAEMRDPYTGGHQQRVAQLARRIAIELKLPQTQAEGIFLTGLLHDIGKINVPAEILSKPGELADIEMEIIKTHSQVGYDILKTVEFPWPVAQCVLQHHERLDGSGYPAGLLADEILLEAKILSAADMVEGMASHRPYRPARGLDSALEELARQRGVRFDPDVVDACLKVFRSGKFSFQPVSGSDVWASGLHGASAT